MDSAEFKKKLTTVVMVAVVLFFANILISNLIEARADSFEVKFLSENIFLQPVKNFGFAFSIPLDLKIIFIVSFLTLAVIAWTFFKYLLSEAYILSFAFGLISGGALANFYERLTNGFVWDYLHLQIYGLNGAWNVADLGIIFGMLTWIIGLALHHYTAHWH